MKILVVEDNQLILKVIETKLKKEGYDVISCENGKEAIEKITRLFARFSYYRYNASIQFRIGNCKFCKSKSEKNIPVIVLSGMGQEKTIEEAFKLGADDYMTKPFSLSELSMRIKRFSRVFNAA